MRTTMIQEMNEDLTRILNWGDKNRVEFNASKTQCCFASLKLSRAFDPISFGGQDIRRSNNLTILGININESLTGAIIYVLLPKPPPNASGF